uniref:DNA repair protein XRCC4 n=1 Tax=Geotrypetes seraphini TaxID=260995 RepID=A0A6P8PVP6_GEOSA|nr:DNA repair protein XRCC4 [Geotrypetes seraphini]XP_033779452.1 DNA repair protein XRCC4 [Geotrypetes seraphini]
MEEPQQKDNRSMEKKISRICPLSDPKTTYFLQVAWTTDLGSGFTLTLCNGKSAWSGTVSEDEISKEASDMEMEREKYIGELQKALILDAELTSKYNFDFSEDKESSDICHFSYEKNLKNVSFKLGSVKLKKISDPVEVIKELIGYCLDYTADLHAKNEYLQKENKRLLNNWDEMHEILDKSVQVKEELEQELYSKFVLVLNEKKSKIRSLQEKLKEAHETAKQTRDSQPSVSNTIINTEDYNVSTDEEKESQSVYIPTDHAASSRSHSLLSTPDDVPDVAPNRKRRQRQQKKTVTESKVTKKQPVTQKQERLNPAPLPKTSKSLSSGRMSLETLENTADPEDLFDDM